MSAKLTLSAGMPRSGSTWIYNAIRIMMLGEFSNPNFFSCGWLEDWQYVPLNRHNLLKIHNYEAPWVNRADLVIYSYRDVRDVLASMHRMFRYQPSIETADHLIDTDHKWRRAADLIISYEQLFDKPRLLEQLAQALGLTVDINHVLDELDRLEPNGSGTVNGSYDPVSLYHPGHITHGGNGVWGELDEVLIESVTSKHRSWLERNDYPVEKKLP